jgi:hypothetical protein
MGVMGHGSGFCWGRWAVGFLDEGEVGFVWAAFHGPVDAEVEADEEGVGVTEHLADGGVEFGLEAVLAAAVEEAFGEGESGGGDGGSLWGVWG